MKDETQQTRSNGQQRPGQRVGREALLEAVSKEQALLARLDREQGDARTRLAALHADLASLGCRWPQLDPASPRSRDGLAGDCRSWSLQTGAGDAERVSGCGDDW